jgi:hypothetical protein
MHTADTVHNRINMRMANGILSKKSMAGATASYASQATARMGHSSEPHSGHSTVEDADMVRTQVL